MTINKWPNSPKAIDYQKHLALISEAMSIDAFESLAVSSADYDFEIFQDILNKINYCDLFVFHHEDIEQIEIAKLRLHATVGSSEKKFSAVSRIKNELISYIDTNVSEAVAYDKNVKTIKADMVISYAYLHKKLMRLLPFSKSPEPTQELKQAIEDCISHGYLIELSKEVTKEKYESSARMFKIVVPALND